MDRVNLESRGAGLPPRHKHVYRPSENPFPLPNASRIWYARSNPSSSPNPKAPNLAESEIRPGRLIAPFIIYRRLFLGRCLVSPIRQRKLRYEGDVENWVIMARRRRRRHSIATTRDSFSNLRAKFAELQFLWLTCTHDLRGPTTA